MKCKKIISMVLTAAMLVAFGSGNVWASKTSEAKNEAPFTEISKRERVFCESDEVEREANKIERQNVRDTYYVSDEAAVCSDEAVGDVSENTDPNHAYIVSNETIMQGNISTAGEMRWYAFSLEEKSKVTILVQMVESLDADLYMFALNGSQLGLIGGSGTEGGGVTEYYNSVLEAGVYFFAVGGYEGTGAFAFAFYQNSVDVGYEPNDTLDAASEIDFDLDITGVIDSPYDVDYFKIIVSRRTAFRYGITSSDGYTLTLVKNDGDSSGMFQYKNAEGLYEFMPGTYYFRVSSPQGKYSPDSIYHVNFTKIGNLAMSSLATTIYVCETGKIVYQTNEQGTVYYVNGNNIDFHYSYERYLENPAGLQVYDIRIDPSKVDYVGAPSSLYYIRSTKPAMEVSGRSVLRLALFGQDCYTIHCNCTGEYAMNTYNRDFSYAVVLIDPESGKLIDIFENNYYYDFCPTGSNQILFYSGGYNMKKL